MAIKQKAELLARKDLYSQKLKAGLPARIDLYPQKLKDMKAKEKGRVPSLKGLINEETFRRINKGEKGLYSTTRSVYLEQTNLQPRRRGYKQKADILVAIKRYEV